MSLYTGKGDEGTTKLFDSKPGERISKSSAISECLGTFDELNSTIGWCKVACHEESLLIGKPLSLVLNEVQDTLFTIQAELAGAPKTVHEWSVRDLSILVHAAEAELKPITKFTVAGGTELATRFDIARTIARRAERRLVAVHDEGIRPVGEHTRAYANRLSSLLFALGRITNERAGVIEHAPEYRG